METINQEVALLEKKKQASKTWMRLDIKGRRLFLGVNKHAVMEHAGLPARDLRILDPLLHYPSTILGRERAIVLNLEHIKAIITAEEVLLRDSMNDLVTPLVEELSKCLPLGKSNSWGHEWPDAQRELDDNGTMLQSIHQDVNTSDINVPSFEFRALEVALDSICSFLYAQTIELEEKAYPAGEELIKKISGHNLDNMRKLKGSMTRLTARVRKVEDELEQLLQDDDDMTELYLTRKIRRGISTQELTSFHSQTSSLDRGVSTSAHSDDVDELEMLLEAYLIQVDSTSNKLLTLRKYIDDTEDFINIRLDSRRNQHIKLNLILTSANVAVTSSGYITGIFGMNIRIPFADHAETFIWVLVLTFFTCLAIFAMLMSHARHKQLMLVDIGFSGRRMMR